MHPYKCSYISTIRGSNTPYLFICGRLQPLKSKCTSVKVLCCQMELYVIALICLSLLLLTAENL